jgi:hypothetical protein
MNTAIKAIEIFLEASFQEKIDIIAFSVVESVKYVFASIVSIVVGIVCRILSLTFPVIVLCVIASALARTGAAVSGAGSF